MFDKDRIWSFTGPNFDFGGGASETYGFRLPPEYQGELIGIGVATTEVFATATTNATVELGTATDADAYAKLIVADATADNDFFDTTDDTDAIISASVAAGDLVKVTLTNGADTSAVTGQGIPVFTFRIWK